MKNNVTDLPKTKMLIFFDILCLNIASDITQTLHQVVFMNQIIETENLYFKDFIDYTNITEIH